jgi:aminoglycoside 3-N-acetyltransferase
MQHQSTLASGPGARPSVTEKELVRDLRGLGVERGQALLVHASLRSLGWVVGGAPTVVSALREAVGPDGHVVVPAGTEANSQTSREHHARIATLTPEEVDAFERNMPAFDSGSTPSGMGAVSEALRTAEGAARSAHPQSSFAAIGPRADWLMAGHPLHSHLGPTSPLGKLAELAELTGQDAQVLMMGVGYWAFTGFHLAEYTYRPDPPMRKYACVVTAADGAPAWEYYEDVVLDDQEFDVIGQALERSLGQKVIKHGKVGRASCRLVPLQPAVQFARKWLLKSRG